MKRFYVMIISFLLMLVVINVNDPSKVEKVNYHSLSEEEVNQFMEERNLEPLAIESTALETVVLVDGGTYSLSKKGDSGEISESSVRWGGGLNEVQLGFRGTGSPYVHVILDDETLIEQIHWVEVVFKDGKMVSKLAEGRRGFLLFYDKQSTNNTVEGFTVHICDKKEKVLYEKRS